MTLAQASSARTRPWAVLVVVLAPALVRCGESSTEGGAPDRTPDVLVVDASGAGGSSNIDANASSDGASITDASVSTPDDVAVHPQADAEPDAAGPVDAGEPRVRFIARVDLSDPKGPRFAWSGSTALARFTGSSIGVRLGGKANYYDIRIDGMLQPTLVTSANKEDYPLATNLPAGPHELSVFKRTEAREGVTTFLGLILDPAGALLPPSAPSGRRLEIVGDSTTTGYGDEGKSSNCPFSPATENYDVAYGAVAARAVNAELITIAWSAKGIYRNFAGDMTETMPVLYGRALPDPSSKWDYASWIPDAVLINLGSNDFQQGDPGQGYVTTYTAFIHRLRGYYPQAFILCAVGPKLSGKQLDGARTYVQGIVSAVNSAGDMRVGFLELPQAEPADGYGCGGHASIATHKRMGDVLAAELKSKLGW
jgi:lysophospholipase L1-like esterase